ncbi:hypothetical protein TWF506_001574 [Arthrobotrys conoides]|uniref:Uncharacterized protein n=1 Tax=Arthrobotrys conoides TaxID=74498 RepID=A0AAN8NN01_9PEZI
MEIVGAIPTRLLNELEIFYRVSRGFVAKFHPKDTPKSQDPSKYRRTSYPVDEMDVDGEPSGVTSRLAAAVRALEGVSGSEVISEESAGKMRASTADGLIKVSDA